MSQMHIKDGDTWRALTAADFSGSGTAGVPTEEQKQAFRTLYGLAELPDGAVSGLGLNADGEIVGPDGVVLDAPTAQALVEGGGITWAAKPSAASAGIGTPIRVSDIGGATFRAGADGFWHPDNGAAVIASNASPIILSSSATGITATGAVTGATALPYTPSGVCRVFMALGASGGTTGLYYARYSSATAFQLYTDAAGTVTPTGLTAGAYAGTTASVTLATVLVPAGIMCLNGALRVNAKYQCLPSANNKTLSVMLGNAVLLNGVTNNSAVRAFKIQNGFIQNRGSASSQIGESDSAYGGSNGLNSGVVALSSVNTAQDQNLKFTFQNAVVSEYGILDAYTVEVLA